MNNFIKTTVFGGVAFLIPLVIIAAALGKALTVIHDIAEPLLLKRGVDTFFPTLTPHTEQGLPRSDRASEAIK